MHCRSKRRSLSRQYLPIFDEMALATEHSGCKVPEVVQDAARSGANPRRGKPYLYLFTSTRDR